MIRIDKVQELLSRARELCREQEIRKGELEANYKESFERGTKENWTGELVVVHRSNVRYCL